MAKAKVKYRQCTLELTVDQGTVVKDVAWIPSKYAKLNGFVKIQKNGVWVNGWKVTGVGSHEIDEVPDINKQIRGHRKNTGDSLR